MTNARNTVLYTGVTNDLMRRVEEHNMKLTKSFTGQYNICKLVYYEKHGYVSDAIGREKQIKSGSRNKKIQLINSTNPNWTDLGKAFTI